MIALSYPMPKTYPIHHEVMSARTASEVDGQGHFDVIEWHPGEYAVHQSDGGLKLFETTRKREAYAYARRQARDYDRK